MVQLVPPPDTRSLLPPLLACLPTAFASPKPPPALLPLLSPILRQRVQLLATTASSSSSSSSSDSWLPLLCWESGTAKKLVDTVTESDAFELHPVSGEIDYGEVGELRYRRLDEETLQARVVVTSLEILVIYLWCEGDPEGGGDGWRASEVRPLAEGVQSDLGSWWSTIAEADEKAEETMLDDAIRQGEENTIPQISRSDDKTTYQESGDSDDDYWAQYDKTPGRTPARTPAPKEPSASSSALPQEARSTSEGQYYAQYAQVQPEMDNDDPSEDRAAVGESTVNGDMIASAIGQTPIAGGSNVSKPHGLTNGSSAKAQDFNIRHPTASSPTLGAVSRLEESAESQSVAEVAIRQHISTSIKSMFRLCRSTGVDIAEFDRMVRTELSTLSMMAKDD